MPIKKKDLDKFRKLLEEEKKKVEKPKPAPKKRELPIANIETTKGTIQLELEPTEAPIAVANFITLGFFDSIEGLGAR